jgi:hypothetical protein
MSSHQGERATWGTLPLFHYFLDRIYGISSPSETRAREVSRGKDFFVHFEFPEEIQNTKSLREGV